jgi:hypothetical protein
MTPFAPSPPSAPVPSPVQESPAPELPSPPAPASIAEPAPALSSVPILADIWSASSDEEGKGGPAEEWSLASDEESEANPDVVDVVENWSSASQDSSSGSSNSRMVASLSRITLDLQSDIPLLVLDEVPLYSDDFRFIARSYGSQDFGHLADKMFEDSGPK